MAKERENAPTRGQCVLTPPNPAARFRVRPVDLVAHAAPPSALKRGGHGRQPSMILADTRGRHVRQEHPMSTRWMSMADAANELKISTRTLQRRIQAGRLQTMTDAGRRLVAVDVADNRDNVADNVADTVADMADTAASTIQTAQGQAAALTIMADRVTSMANTRLDELHQDVQAARRSARAGWTLAAAGFAVAALAGLWSVRAVGDANARQAAADAARTNLAAQAETERVRVSELQDKLADVADRNARALADAANENPFRPLAMP
jgi:hypothetical protein